MRSEAMSEDDDSHLHATGPGRGRSGRGADGGAASREAAGAVVRLFDRDARNPSRVVNELRAYWQGLRRGRSIPTRADVEPDGMRRSLDYAFILERIAPGAARFRLAGRHLVDVMGMEVRGMPVCSFFNPAARGHLSDLLETVFHAPQMLELALASPADYGRPALNGRMLLLPLRSDLGDVTRALGCLIVEGETGRAPRRFDIEDHAVEPVIPGGRTLAPAAGFQEPADAWRAQDVAPPVRQPRPRRRPAAAPSQTPPPEPPPAATPEELRALFRLISRD